MHSRLFALQRPPLSPRPDPIIDRPTPGAQPTPTHRHVAPRLLLDQVVDQGDGGARGQGQQGGREDGGGGCDLHGRSGGVGFGLMRRRRGSCGRGLCTWKSGGERQDIKQCGGLVVGVWLQTCQAGGRVGIWGPSQAVHWHGRRALTGSPQPDLTGAAGRRNSNSTKRGGVPTHLDAVAGAKCQARAGKPMGRGCKTRAQSIEQAKNKNAHMFESKQN